MSSFSSLRVNKQIAIPRSELRFSFVRSSGPGGQNVNKVNSKVELRWKIERSSALPNDVRERMTSRYSRRINNRGELVLTSQRYRDQGKNIDDCLTKLRDLLSAVATPPRRRKKTAPPRSARESRLRDKRSVANKKRERKRPVGDD
jgi:ribosome-associated protein